MEDGLERLKGKDDEMTVPASHGFEVISNISRTMTQADKGVQGLVGDSPTVPEKTQFSDVRSA